MNHGLLRFIAPLLLAFLSVNAQAVEEVIYYHNDALGSPIIATDQEGRVVWRNSYAPYGQSIGPSAPNEPGYTGKFEEPGLGIQDFGARWYDPRIGRFLAIDPVGFDPQNPQSFNRYAYANNNPYKYLDPNGESPLDVGFFIADTVSFGLALYSGNPQAIPSAGADLAASAVGLASPIPGTGLAIKAARAADKAGDVVKSGYHATHPEAAEAILQGGFRQGTKPGRLGSRGTYVNNAPEGAIAEFAHHNPGVTPKVLKVEYNPGTNASASVIPGQYVNQHPLNVDSISAPSIRAPGTVNTNVLNGSARATEILP
jgi:RHS repeat-associated protein